MGLSFEEYRDYIPLTPYPRPEPFRSMEEMQEACDALLKFLLREKGLIAAFSATYEKKRELVREYMTSRAATPIPGDILELQDRLFWTETVGRGIVDPDTLPEVKYGISLWEGDIVRLGADAIVNAANSRLLGCWRPGHKCIDNAIHSFAGMQLRRDCACIMAHQGHPEECGEAKVTRAYNLPSKYVIHTVGPMCGREVTREQRGELRGCYISSLNLAEEIGYRSIAFCCVSTGVFNFPHEAAAEIAVGAVMNWKMHHPSSKIKVIFNTYLGEDTEIYREILKFV